MTKHTCPIPQTHDRLNQAFSMFDEIVERYQNPDQFTTTLNDLIQALRNVTFILQAEKAKIPNFDEWYPPQQEKMKTDDVMRWLIDARNHVVKRGDLEKKSFLRFKIKNHFDENLFSKEFDPYISLDEASEIFRKLFKIELPDHFLEETIIEAERAWVVEQYPKAEVTDVLIYCLRILTDVVYIAHEECCGVNALSCEKNLFVEQDSDFMVLIHNKVKHGRIRNFLYKGGEVLVANTTKYDPFAKVEGSEETVNEFAKNRYGTPEKAAKLYDKSDEDLPFNQLPYHVEMAKHLFDIDKYLASVAFLYFPNRPPMMLELQMNEPADRYIMMERIAEQVDETHCKAVVLVGEMWTGEHRDGEELIPARLQKERREHLSIIGASPAKVEERLVEILRGEDGSITYGKEEIFKENPLSFPMLSRIYKVWKHDN